MGGATVDSLRQRLVELSRLEEERWAEIVYERRLAEDAEKHADAFCQDAAMLQVRLQGLEKAESLLRQAMQGCSKCKRSAATPADTSQREFVNSSCVAKKKKKKKKKKSLCVCTPS